LDEDPELDEQDVVAVENSFDLGPRWGARLDLLGAIDKHLIDRSECRIMSEQLEVKEEW
jgi:hypothetical protein